VREIDVVMSSFKFEPGSEEPIVVSQGDTVKLCCTAEDNGIGAGHGLGIPAYDVNVAPVTTEDEKCTEFAADEAGEFRMQCTIQCSQPGAGGGHKDMVGTFIVE
jgi:heme/copper-type cytochrome/quinol oxidase subunit 2